MTKSTRNDRAFRVSALPGSCAAIALISSAGVGCGVDTNGLFDSPVVDAGTGPFNGLVDATTAVDTGGRPLNPPDERDAETEAETDAAVVVDATTPARDASADASRDAKPDAKPDTGTGPVSACDADGDGFKSIACGGNDCCDLDPEVYPRANAPWYGGADRCGYDDYDCDGTVFLRYGKISCTIFNGVCEGEGYLNTPVCGNQATWEACTLASGTCAPDPTSAHPQSQQCH